MSKNQLAITVISVALARLVLFVVVERHLLCRVPSVVSAHMHVSVPWIGRPFYPDFTYLPNIRWDIKLRRIVTVPFSPVSMTPGVSAQANFKVDSTRLCF